MVRYRFDPLPCLLVMVLVLLVGLPAPGHALPRYAVQYGQSCTLCHENPTGGGMRTPYASQYLVPEEIAANGWLPLTDAMGNEILPDPQLTPYLTVGADLRTLVYQREEGIGGTFAMQGDLYVNLNLAPGASAYIEQGLNNSGEIYGLVRGGPADGYVKAGRFIPDYGWRFADHQMFNRRYLMDAAGSDSPAFLYDAGLEGGVSPGPFELTASLLSGPAGHGDNYAARALVRQEVGGVKLGVGASVLRRFDPFGHRRAVGGFWAVAAGPVVWLGEIDETRRPDGPGETMRLGNLVAQEVTVRVKRGWDARFTYSYQDPDRAEKTGVRHRYGAGAAYMPRPFFALQLMVNRWDVEEGPALDGGDAVEAELMLHVFY